MKGLKSAVVPGRFVAFAAVAVVVLAGGSLVVGLFRPSPSPVAEGVPPTGATVFVEGPFWRRSAAPTEGSVPVAEIVERVRHAFRGEEVQAAHYTARAEADGRFRFGSASDEAAPGLLFGAADGVAWTTEGNTAQKRRANGWVEHWEAGEGRVEVAWVIDSPPQRLEETLTLRTPLEGLPLARTDEAGFHFRDPDGEASIRVTHAELVDSGGRRWPLDDRVVGGVLEIDVPPDLLAQAEYPVAVDPVVSWEAVVPDPKAVPLARYQGEPAVAWSGSVYLIAWTDGRYASDLDIYATRYSTTGGVLDPGGIPLTRAAGDQRNPRVAVSGGSFLVAWDDARNGNKDGGGAEHDVFANVVAADGSLATSSGFALASTSAVESGPDVAGGSDGFFAVWAADGRIMGRHVSADGQTLSEPMTVLSDAGTHSLPAVVAGESRDLVVWNALTGTGRHVQGRLVDRESGAVSALLEIGTFGSPHMQHERAAGLRPAAAAGPDGFLVAWPGRYEYSLLQPDCVDCPPAYVGPVWVEARRLTAQGDFLDSDPLVVRGGRDFFPGDPFIGNTPRVGRVDVVSQSLGEGFMVAWEEPGVLDGAIFQSEIDASGALSHPPTDTELGGVSVTPDSPRAGKPALAPGWFESLLVWEDQSIARERYAQASPEVQVTARRLHRIATLPDNLGEFSPVAVAPYPAQAATAPVIAARGGGQFLIVWGEPGLRAEEDATGPAVYGILYRSATGPVSSAPSGLIERGPFLLARPAAAPETVATASDRDGYVVAWTEQAEPGIRVLRATATDGDGKIRWWSQTVASGPSEALRHATPRLSLDAGAGGAVVVWEVAQADSRGVLAPDVAAAAITERSLGGGRPLSRLRPIEPLGTAMRLRSDPAVAASGGVFLLTWRADGESSAPAIHGARVDLRLLANSAFTVPVRDRMSLEGLGGGFVSPALAGDGRGWLIAYEDRSRGGEQRDVSASYLRLEHAAPGPQFAIAAQDYGEFAPMAAYTPGAGFLVSWLDDRAKPPDGIGWAGGFREAVFGSQVTADGVVLHPEGFLIDPANAGVSRSRPELSVAGSEFLLSYLGPPGDEKPLRFRRVVPDALPTFTAIERLPDSSVRLEISNPAGLDFRLEVSRDLREWQPLDVEADDVVLDLSAAGESMRFYRIVLSGTE